MPPPVEPSITLPLPTADMTRPLISRGTRSAINAVDAGMYRATARAAPTLTSSTWTKLVASTMEGRDTSERSTAANSVLARPYLSATMPAGMVRPIFIKDSMRSIRPHFTLEIPTTSVA